MSDSNEKITAPRPTGAGLMGGGGRGGMRGAVEKPKDFWGTARRLLGYLRPQRVKLILVVILAVSSTAFAVWAPKISGNAVNELMNGELREQVSDEVKEELRGLKSFLGAISIIGEMSTRSQDVVIGMGEKLSACIFAAPDVQLIRASI